MMNSPGARSPPGTVRLFLAGDVMLGRGVDQILAHPCDPAIHESYLQSAVDYVRLAEMRQGPLPRAVPGDYVWGDLLGELDRRGCDVRLINLETAITTSDDADPKAINYRMCPENAAALRAAQIDACILANNHVMDWGLTGLIETLQTLAALEIGGVGAGRTSREASAPLILGVPGKGRVLLVAFGSETSGIPLRWAAAAQRPGINILPRNRNETVAQTRKIIEPIRQAGDILVFSIHWGGNWGYTLDPADHALAHALIDEAGVDVVFGHSSHHPKAVEVYNGKLILHGCGDLINDYEGIGGHEAFRGDLALAYFADVRMDDATLHSLEMVPYRIRSFRLQSAGTEEVSWLADVMARECGAFAASIAQTAGGALRLSWC